MSNHNHWVRAATPHSPAAPARTRYRGTEPGAVLRALFLGVGVFVAAVLTAGVLAGAAPAGPVPPAQSSTTDPAGSVVLVAEQQQRATAPDLSFAYSMIYSGAVALVVSIVGTVMVARRRRLW